MLLSIIRSKISVFLLLGSVLVRGQESESQLAEYRSYPNDTSKVNLLYNKGFTLRNNDLQGAVKFAQACYQTALLVKNNQFIAKAINLQATLKAEMGMHKEAARDFTKALQLFIQTADTLSEAIILNNLGNIYGYLNEKVKAFTCYENSLHLAAAIENDQWVNRAILGIASLQVEEKNFKPAEENFETLLGFAEANSDYDLLFECYKNIGLCKLNLGDTLAAESYQLMVLDLTEMMEDSIGHADAYINLGEIYLAKKKFTESFSCLQKALVIAQKNNYNEGLVRSWKDISSYYEETKNLKMAYFYLAKHDSAVEKNSSIVVEDVSSLWKENSGYEIKTEVSLYSVRNIFQLLLIGAVILILVFVLKQSGNEQKRQEE